MAELFLARHLGAAGFERTVVIKRLHKHLTDSPDVLRLFLSEARLAARLNHPNVVTITDLGEADGTYFIAMEYLAGEDLATLLRMLKKRGLPPLPVPVALRVVGQAALGLHFAHEALDDDGQPLKLVHRDVTPSNLFIAYTGQVKVLDFGIAKAVTSGPQTKTGVMRGTAHYMSPEQASAEALDRRSDIYALGICLYEAISQARPFARGSDYDTMKAMVTGDYTPLLDVAPTLPDDVIRLVEKAMAPLPENRFATAADFAREAERVAGPLGAVEGVETLQRFVAELAGPERVQLRTRLAGAIQRRNSAPALAQLRPEGPAPDGAAVTRTHPGTQTDTVSVRSPPKQSRWWPLVGVGVVVLLAVLTAAFVWAPTAPPRTLTPLTPLPSPPVLAALPEVVAPPPEPVVEHVEPVDTAPKGVDAGVKVKPTVKPPKIGARREEDTRRVLADGTPRLLQCFKKFKPLVPSPMGRVDLMLDVDGTGRVTKASVDIGESDLARCLRGIAKELRFAPSLDRATAVPVALNYDVR